MDGYELSTFDEVDEDAFAVEEEEDEDMPLPDCIGIDSAVQDDEQVRIQQSEQRSKRPKTRSEIEHELELKMLKPDSIRRQILERSLNDESNKRDKSAVPAKGQAANRRSHVINIVEKAGMKGIDKEKINEIIHEASKGSLFYKKQAQRQEEIHRSIGKMLSKVEKATSTQVANAKITCDRILEELERQRVFNKVIVHFDLDMFFAAVEIRDNPELADKPIAVGGDSMVSTSNYIARRFGVRAAMPGFIARKLCPGLLLIKPNGSKYRQASAEVFSILELYDPELTGMSLDEAYLDLTEYIKNTLERDGLEVEEYYDGTLPKIWWSRASEIVEEIRQAIFDKTKLTCSAGIACNTLLAKISTDINKPDGQFMVEGYPKDVSNFIRETPVEKVSGIGKVSGQFLHALEIRTCGDIHEKRDFLPLVFYDINVKFYLRVALGDGSTCIKSDEQRKSKSVERTFAVVRDPLILLDKLDSICEELCSKYLKPYRIRGRTITIKLKRNTFTTTTKSYSMLLPTNDKLVIYSAAKNLLLAEVANEPLEIGYRLLGVKLSNLADDGVTAHQMTIDAMLRNQELKKSTKTETTVYRVDDSSSSQGTNEKLSEYEYETPEESLDVAIIDDSNKPTQISQLSRGETCEVGSKRKDPSFKRIDDFFQATSQKQVKQSQGVFKRDYHDNTQIPENADESAANQELQDNEGTEHNEMSDENNAKTEDFQCPYCFKSCSNFDILENHVSKCNLKCSFDLYRPLFSQRVESPSVKRPDIMIASSQPTATKRIRSCKAAKINLVKTSIQDQSTTPTPTQALESPSSGFSPKKSFYQKFVESNSQSFSQSPKVEPMQCPYCMHGFFNFVLLENHVMMCTKNNNR